MARLLLVAVLAFALQPSLGSRAASKPVVADRRTDGGASPPLWHSRPQQEHLSAPALLERRHEAARRSLAQDGAAEGRGEAGFLGLLHEAARRTGGRARAGGLAQQVSLEDSSLFRNPKVWGPVAWFFVHDVAFSQEQEIPVDQQEKLIFFFTEELADILPCDESQARTRKAIKSMQPIDKETWSNRTKLITWVIMLHNHINLDMERQAVPVERVLGHYVSMFDKAEPVAITFDPSKDSGVDPQEAFPKVWYPGGIKTPEVIRFRMPKVWGPVGWFFLQSLALAQDDSRPSKHKEALVHFYTQSLSYVLPCPFCGMHLRGHLDSGRSPLPNASMTRVELARWVNDLHNVVNREKTEPSEQFPWEKVVTGFNHQYAAGPPIDAYLGNGPLETPHSGALPAADRWALAVALMTLVTLVLP